MATIKDSFLWFKNVYVKSLTFLYESIVHTLYYSLCTVLKVHEALHCIKGIHTWNLELATRDFHEGYMAPSKVSLRIEPEQVYVHASGKLVT
jgi:hypothetical protein